MDRKTLLALTADIVAAHVGHNRVSAGDLPRMILQVHEAFQGLGRPAEQEPEKKTPAVSVRASVKPDYIICLECGKNQKIMKRHLMAAHGMTPDQYRSAFDLPASYPMIAQNYSKHRSHLAKTLGLGRKSESIQLDQNAVPSDHAAGAGQET
jgi:predicted transcriptional regulator